MRNIISIFMLTFSISAFAGLSPWEKLPKQDEPIKLSNNFSSEYWVVQDYKFDDTHDETQSIRSVIKTMGSGNLFEYDHHIFVCYQNDSQYLYIYDSGWGPGYALVSKPIPYMQECTPTDKPLKLGSLLKLGQNKEEVEEILNTKLPSEVADLSFEEVINKEVPPNKICPIWNNVTLKITFSSNSVSGIYFDDHSEPYDDCKTI